MGNPAHYRAQAYRDYDEFPLYRGPWPVGVPGIWVEDLECITSAAGNEDDFVDVVLAAKGLL